jgi:hypothetical protein
VACLRPRLCRGLRVKILEPAEQAKPRARRRGQRLQPHKELLGRWRLKTGNPKLPGNPTTASPQLCRTPRLASRICAFWHYITIWATRRVPIHDTRSCRDAASDTSNFPTIQQYRAQREHFNVLLAQRYNRFVASRFLEVQREARAWGWASLL